MLYEPSNTKKYITGGVFAIVLAIVVAIFYLRSKDVQVPASSPSPQNQVEVRKQKIQKDMKEAVEKLKDQPVSQQQVKDVNSVGEDLKKMPASSPEEMQKVSDELKKTK